MEKDNTKELGQIVKDLLEVMKLQQNMHDRLHNHVDFIDENLQKQINNLQEQVKLLAKAGVKVTEGFEQLHKTALGDPYPRLPEETPREKELRRIEELKQNHENFMGGSGDEVLD